MAIQVVCRSCESTYNLKEEYAGRKVRCPKCQGVLEVPEAESRDEAYPSDDGLHPAFERDTRIDAMPLKKLSPLAEYRAKGWSIGGYVKMLKPFGRLN